MKQHTKWITTAVAVAGGLAFVSSVQAQAITGDATLDNIPPASITALYASWGTPVATITDGPAGLEVNSLGYGSMYDSIPLPQQQTLNTGDNTATLVMTVNNAVSPASANYWLGIPFILDDNVSSDTYGGYAGMFGYTGAGTAVWNGNTVTESVPLDPDQLAAIQAGGDVINAFNLELDPAVLPVGAPFYDVTFNSLTLSHVPDASSTLALLGSASAALFAFRRRNK
jgi:hypothetical protein